jgi:hypothetical protein
LSTVNHTRNAKRTEASFGFRDVYSFDFLALVAISINEQFVDRCEFGFRCIPYYAVYSRSFLAFIGGNGTYSEGTSLPRSDEIVLLLSKTSSLFVVVCHSNLNLLLLHVSKDTCPVDIVPTTKLLYCFICILNFHVFVNT